MSFWRDERSSDTVDLLLVLACFLAAIYLVFRYGS